jgi:immune inhibitor A
MNGFRAGWRGLAGVCLAVLLVALAIPPAARAQDGKRGARLSWNDAPLVPRHRSPADWLVDAGWKTVDEMYGPFPTREYQVGDVEQFIPLGSFDRTPEPFLLRYRTEHAYFWFQRGAQTSQAALETAANFFEDHIWPLNNSLYDDEWLPGIDGDSRMHIVNQIYISPGVLGAFNPEDQCPRSVCPESNQREIVYINLDIAPLGTTEYLTTLAHEHQHLLQYHADGNEQRWFDEGLSQLAEHLNGFNPRDIGDYNLINFLRHPDHHLNGWAVNPADTGRHYGASYLFLVYLYEQFGLEFIREVASSDYDGLAGVQQTLLARGVEAGVDEVFGGWIVANLLDASGVGGGRYYYQSLDLPERIEPSALVLVDGGAVHSDTLNQYGADYLMLDQPGAYHLTFDGSDRTSVMGIMPHSDDWMWWSYNNNSSATRLTASFDLRGLSSATLSFSAWWNVEEDYDWFQVLVSDNGGQGWVIVSGAQATPDGPKAPGAHYSGRSLNWVDEQIDLGAFAGKEVLIRFEYLTDSTDTMSGVALDDIGIRELDYLDDVEAVRSAWLPEGFLRIPDVVPQAWTVSLVTEAGGDPRVESLALDEFNTGRATVVVPEGGRVTLAIGAMAPFTANLATYKLSVQQVP